MFDEKSLSTSYLHQLVESAKPTYSLNIKSKTLGLVLGNPNLPREKTSPQDGGEVYLFYKKN